MPFIEWKSSGFAKINAKLVNTKQTEQQLIASVACCKIVIYALIGFVLANCVLLIS